MGFATDALQLASGLTAGTAPGAAGLVSGITDSIPGLGGEGPSSATSSGQAGNLSIAGTSFTPLDTPGSSLLPLALTGGLVLVVALALKKGR